MCVDRQAWSAAQSMGSQIVGHDWATELNRSMHIYIYIYICIWSIPLFFKKLKNSILSVLAHRNVNSSGMTHWKLRGGREMLLFLSFVVYYFCIHTVVYFCSIHEKQDEFMLTSTIENGNTITIHYFWKSSGLPKHEHCWNTAKTVHLTFSTVTRKQCFWLAEFSYMHKHLGL